MNHPTDTRCIHTQYLVETGVLVKDPPAMEETRVRFLGREDSLEKE